MEEHMLIVTTNDVAGFRITKVIGEVNGLTVRTRNVGAQIGASFKALVGGELAGMTRQLQETRDEALDRLIEAAQAKGANAVIGMRYDSNELYGTYQEILAYGTAVIIEEL
ncbi:MAG: YbjQ family protein [Actinomycetota bacterium]|jgi:uncharacterized protein YbjQ (UPF0145 family)